MTASTSMSVFHQWLLLDPENTTSAHAIVLHTADAATCDRLIEEISEYLNEYDDEGDGRWLPATPELVEKVACDPSHRRLIGLPDDAEREPTGSQPDLANTLAALGKRGHVVFRTPGLTDDELGLKNAFHAGVGPLDEAGECHLVLNPERIGRKCIAHIIGDVFLEWLHCETHRDSIQDIR